MPRLIRLPQRTECAFVDELTIGRSLHCSYVLEDISVSRQHCRIHMINNNWHVTDTSSNGILINRRNNGKHKTQPIHDNDSLTIGTFEFRFKEQTEGNDYAVDLDDSVIIIEDDPPDAEARSEAEKPLTEEPASEGASPSNHAATAANSSLNEELTCSICMELFISASTLNCCHTFCESCIMEWRRTNIGCPICRQKVTTCIRSMTIDNIVNRIISHDTSEVQQARKSLVESRQISRNITAPASSRASRQTRGRGRARGRGRGRALRRAPMAFDFNDSEIWLDSDSDDEVDILMRAHFEFGL